MPVESDKTILGLLKNLGKHVCRDLNEKMRDATIDELSAVSREAADDTIYSIDETAEKIIVDWISDKWKNGPSFVLIVEGGPPEGMVFSTSGRRSDCEYTVIMDPLDGTRGLMYGKRSAWLLSAAARGTVDNLSMRDLFLAVQTEIPPIKQNISDCMWAVKDYGAQGERFNLDSGKACPLALSPSRAADLHYGYATFNRFFTGAKREITAIEHELLLRMEAEGHLTFSFEDQHICNGGQLAALTTGQDRFVCDIRAKLSPILAAKGRPALLCAHPYDLCCELIAREAGAVVTGSDGKPLDCPLDTTTDVSWIGYANERIRSLIEPHLLDILSSLDRFIF
jgi:fructose-1,6-bisphosphatase/inositol monophosphatase family enzyme